jgi:DNA modification methylase
MTATTGDFDKASPGTTNRLDKAGRRIVVHYRPIAGLNLDPKNPRSHSPKQIGQIARSIEAFGFNVPVLVDGDLKVIAGHGRVLACQKLGWSEVPTISLDHLSRAQAQAFMIADNRLTETSIWDDRLLAEQLKELSVLDLDFSLEATGFEMGEIDLRIEGLTLHPEQEDDPADEVPSFSPAAPISKPGDLWLLGRHRVYCGNSLESDSYAALMNGEHAAMVFTDPPYNVKIDGHASGLGAIRHREFAMASGEMDEAQFTKFLTDACKLLASHSVDGAIHFVCMDWRHMGELLAAGREAYGELKNVCVWAKHNAGMGSLYRSQHELVFVFKHGHAAHHNNVQLGRHGRHRSNVWNYRGVNSFGQSGEEGNLLALHPTVKPVALVADAIMDCSARGDIVLDAFLGSGSTVIAAERTGRRCFGLELDPLYVDTIIRRWQAYTGEQAKHAASGKLFDELTAATEVHHVH